MNICLVSQNYPPDTAQGGIGTQTWNKARALARLGHRVHVLSALAGPGPEVHDHLDDRVIVHRLQRPDSEPGREMSIYHAHTYWLGYAWTVLKGLHRLSERIAFDVIDFPEYGAEGFAYQLERHPGWSVPVVVQLHGPVAMLATHIGWPERDSELYRVGTFMEGESIRAADRLMACSHAIADFTAGFYDVPRDSIDVVHCGVDTDTFSPIDPPATQSSSVLFVGNVAASKGVVTTIDAVLRLRSKYPRIKLQILGRGSDDVVAGLRSRIASAGAQEHVEFCGFVGRERLPHFYQQAAVFCSPAWYEGGAANVFIEAMACGCPVIASRAGGAPEAISEGETGLLVTPESTDEVVAAIDEILGDDDRRRRMGVMCREKMVESFAMDKYIARVLDVYQRAVDARAAT